MAGFNAWTCHTVCRQLLRGTSCRGSTTEQGQAAQPLMSDSGLTLPAAFREELGEVEPEVAPEAPADIIEQNLPMHTVFEPRVDLMRQSDSSDGGTPGGSRDGAACAATGDGLGEGASAAALAAAAVKKQLAALPRQTPPEPHRVSKEDFDEMVGRGEFVASHTTLFRHDRFRCRVGVFSRHSDRFSAYAWPRSDPFTVVTPVLSWLLCRGRNLDRITKQDH